MLYAFIVCCLLGCAFIGLGIYSFLSNREVAFGFWANAQVFPVENVKAYNRAVGKLWCVFGVVLILICSPLMRSEQNSAAPIFIILGMMAEVIAAMAVYVTVIEKKYRKKT